MVILSFILILLFVGVHLFVRRFTRLMTQPRKPLLSFASGVSISYVTVHLFPEFQSLQKDFNTLLNVPERFHEYSLYLIATIGFLSFYSINHFVKQGKNRDQNEYPSSLVFAIHIGAFVIYNSFIGYYLIKGLDQEPKNLIIFSFAFILHLMVNDVGLRLDHKRRYDPAGSIILAFSVVGGWLLGVFVNIPTLIFAIWFSWLAGGILLNTIKEELPSERSSKLLPFVLGIILSSVLFIIL
mgnify:CR=1 FL=1